MKIRFNIQILLLLSGLYCNAQTTGDSVIIFDNYSSADLYTDLTQKIIWSDSNEKMSGFSIGKATDFNNHSQNCISLVPEAILKSGYRPGSMLASQAIDYRLPTFIDRQNTTCIIEFDALWDELNNSGWGEGGRIVVTLLYDYPEEIPFNAIYNLNEDSPFGRPAYNLRIRNHDKTGPYYSGAFMLYGGGHDMKGEIEKYNNQYWLPGFSSEAGGTTPGQMDSYPLSPTLKNENLSVVGYPAWKHYTWLIEPERLELYIRDINQRESDNELVFFMQIPKTDKPEYDIINEINLAHQTSINRLPVMYNWFRWIEAVRIYFRGSQQTHLANFTIKKVTASTTLALNTNVPKLKVFPNPCSSTFNIHFSNYEPPYTYKLFNFNGNCIKTDVAAGETEKVEVSDLPSGIYILQIKSNELTINRKIIINN